MKYLTSIKMCFSMFTVFVPPFTDWDDNERDNMLLVLPFVGLYIGILWVIATDLSFLFVNEKIMYVVCLFLSLFPLYGSGFIHLDGFLDVSDAIASRATVAKKLKILKDSHVGSFAVVNLFILLFANFYTYLRIYQTLRISKNIRITIAIYIVIMSILFLSRCMSSFILMSFKKIGESEYFDKLNNDVKLRKQKLIIIATVIILIDLLIFALLLGKKRILKVFLLIIPLVAVVISHLFCTYNCYKNFKGVNGDVSGYGICISECIGLITLLVVL